MHYYCTFIISFTCSFFLCGQNNLPKVSSGTLIRIDTFSSKNVEKRNIDIWLPEAYPGDKKYAVLYMHDGQMLYDSTTNWNHQAWDIDYVGQKLMNEKKVRPFIVVGIWNGGSARHSEYFPQKPFESLPKNQQQDIYQAARNNGYSVFQDQYIKSDLYLKFIVDELKPYIDSNFAVEKDKNNTCIMGSSMGGLISMYAICEYPNVFGAAACLSTHWPGIFTMENNPIPESFYRYLENNLPDPTKNKIYFDYGTATLDVMYPPLQAEVDKIMIKKGFSAGSWTTLKFEGEDHSEKAWKKRLPIPLEFLLRR